MTTCTPDSSKRRRRSRGVSPLFHTCAPSKRNMHSLTSSHRSLSPRFPRPRAAGPCPHHNDRPALSGEHPPHGPDGGRLTVHRGLQGGHRLRRGRVRPLVAVGAGRHREGENHPGSQGDGKGPAMDHAPAMMAPQADVAHDVTGSDSVMPLSARTCQFWSVTGPPRDHDACGGWSAARSSCRDNPGLAGL
jgi:hypothetical protein